MFERIKAAFRSVLKDNKPLDKTCYVEVSDVPKPIPGKHIRISCEQPSMGEAIRYINRQNKANPGWYYNIRFPDGRYHWHEFLRLNKDGIVTL